MVDGQEVVVIFGAGATKACGGPLTSEILPLAFRNRQSIANEGFIEVLDKFLVQNFHVPACIDSREDRHYPSLPLLIGLIDIAVDRKHSIGSRWGGNDLARVREALDYVIFAIIEHGLSSITNHYQSFLSKIHESTGKPPTVISLNYDIIADNSLAACSERPTEPIGFPDFGFPDYGCDVATPIYRETPKFGKLLKLHGSLNWLYCPCCHRLDIGVSENGRYMAKALELLYMAEQDRGGLGQRYRCHGSPCPDCRTSVKPVMISPTYMKDYRNPHIALTWYLADRALRQADRAIFVGYSMPSDDVDVIYLLKRALGHLDDRRITVVEYVDQKEHNAWDARQDAWKHKVGARYCTIFGGNIDWQPDGFAAYVDRYV